MRTVLLALTLPVVLTPSAQAQLFRRLFGGRQQVQVQQNACYQQPTYYQAPQYYPTYQAVAAIPLATVPVAVDLQQYIYAVNSSAFQSFRDYQAQKVAQSEATAVAAQPAPVSSVGSDVGLTGAVVLKQNCLQCHQKGHNPKSNFSIFDERGELYANLPLGAMMERITAEDPSQRMPPKRTLASHDVMAVFRMASSGIGVATERVAAVEPTKAKNPFE